MKIVQCENVSKSFPGKKVLKNFNMTLESGKIYGLLGRNGAGKTTLLNLISNRILPQKGEIFLFDRPITKDSLLDMCYMSDYMVGFDGMRIGDILRRASKTYPKWDKKYAKDLMDRFQLRKRDVYGKISKGQTTCVSIIVALASGCQFLVLDEIYSGLDAIVRKDLYDLILDDYERTKRTFLLSSHLIQEMDTMFTDILVMKDGNIILQDTYENVMEKTYLITGRPELLDHIPDEFILDQEKAENYVRFVVYGKNIQKHLEKLEDLGATIGRASLQDLFIGILSEEE